jgi:hypothetical protein
MSALDPDSGEPQRFRAEAARLIGAGDGGGRLARLPRGRDGGYNTREAAEGESESVPPERRTAVDRIVLDAALVERIRATMESVEVYDAAGNVVGLFVPKIDPSEYEELGPEISDEELQRRADSKEPRYTTAEVLRYLEDL